MRFSKQQAIALQIDAAINAYRAANYPAAITLAAAAETASAPGPAKSFFKQMVVSFAGILPRRKRQAPISTRHAIG
jgi:hypothetical protein